MLHDTPAPPTASMSATLGSYEVTVATAVGPRVLDFRRRGGPSLFADLPGVFIEHPSIGRFFFHGGHRLWRAPEVPTTTYRADDEPVNVSHQASSITVEDLGDHSGIVRRIALSDVGEMVKVTHTMVNAGNEPVTLAPWAITQLRIGGTAFLPQATDSRDREGLQANRLLVLWPYTDLTEPEYAIGRDRITIDATSRGTRGKLGLPNERGWCAYLLDDELFVKWARPTAATEATVDMGATVQCYRDSRFVELETLGPLVTLDQGASTDHIEWWTLIDVAGQSIDDALAALPGAPEGLDQ